MVSLEFDIAASPVLLQLAAAGRQTLLNVSILAGIALLTVAFSVCVYRLYFHPLAKYPGPRLAAVSAIYRHYYLVQGRDVTNSLKLHQKYGPIVRITPNFIIFDDAAAWKDIYGHRSGGKKPNPRIETEPTYPGHEALIATKSEEKHGRQRRIFSHAFSDSALRKQEPMFKKYVDMLLANLRRQIAADPEHKFNMVDQYNFTTFDVMGDLTFSEPLGMLEHSDYSPWVKSIFAHIKLGTYFSVARDYPIINHLLRLFAPADLKERRKLHQQFSVDRVERRLKKQVDQPDIWNLVLKQEGGDRALTRKEMYSNSELFMIAGTETTATLLSGMTYYLMKTPHAMRRLRAELDEAFPNGSADITGEKLGQLKYLQACIDEGLRVYPPVPLAIMRRAPEGGAMISGQYMPENTHFGVVQYAAYHNEKNFTDAHEFHPERFLSGGESARFANDNKAVYQPFSVGPHTCLGRNMAWFEMRLIAAEILLNFDLELCPESDNWKDQKTYFLWEKLPLMTKLRPREGRA